MKIKTNILSLLAVGALGAPVSLQAADVSLPPDTVTDAKIDNLDELVVTAQKKVIQSDGSKLTYNLSEDKTTRGATMLDALRKVPMVTVDGQDNIRINGDSNFKIYVNGKEEPMLQANASQIFKSMPAESFAKIEVITEPGAKYDAEGTGGILNLITEQSQTKTKTDGYAGSLSAFIGRSESGVAGFGRTKHGRFTADANVTYATNAIDPNNQFAIREMTNHTDDINHRQVTDGIQKFRFNFLQASLNASYDIDESNLLTFGASYLNMKADADKMTNNISMYDRAGNLRWFSMQDLTGSVLNRSASASVSYQHTFGGDRNHYLVGSYLFNFGRSVLDVISENSTGGDSVSQTQTMSPWTANRQGAYTREHTVQVDYSNPLADGKHLIEAGFKGLFRHNTTDSYSSAGETASTLIKDNDGASYLLQKQNIYAVYASYTGTFDPLSLKAGVRYEHSDMAIDFRREDRKNISHVLNDIVPNAALTYLFSPSSNLRLSYQMRISRPSINQVNPYVVNVLTSVVMSGNPDLKSQTKNIISLQYTNFGRTLGGNIGLEYSYSGNAIESFQYFRDNVLYDTYANIGRRQQIALKGFLNWNLTKKMSLSLNGKLSYVDLKSTSPDAHNHGWQGNYSVNYSWTMPLDIKFSAYIGQSFHNLMLMGHSDGWYYYGLGFNRDFLCSKKLNVAVNASNFLQEYMDYKSYIKTADYTNKNTFRNDNWNVSLSVSWRFGHLREQTKKTNLQIDNDDKETSGNKSSGIGL